MLEIEIGFKAIFNRESGRSTVEISRHKDPILSHILIVNSIGSKRYDNSWIIEKDLPVWVSYLESDGYNQIKIGKDVESFKKNNKKK